MGRVYELLPELQQWNEGRGISASDWLPAFARTDQALAYATLFWPGFAVIDGCVLREPASAKALRRWKKKSPAVMPRVQIEALWNMLLVDDLLFQGEELTPLVEQRMAHLVRLLAEIHEVKLAHDFPERRFVVEVRDGSEPEHGGEVSLSFWQSE